MNALMKEKDNDIISRLHFGNQFPKQPDVWIQVTVPNEFQKVGRLNIGITAGIETTHASQEFIEGMQEQNDISEVTAKQIIKMREDLINLMSPLTYLTGGLKFDIASAFEESLENVKGD